MVIKQPEDWQVFPKPELQARAKNTNNTCFFSPDKCFNFGRGRQA
jgi:hypothetical protein